MRYLAFVRALLIVMAVLSVSVPMASAQEPYPYFRRTGDIPVTVSSTVAEAISSEPKVGVHLTADRSEANPGDDVRYWIKVVNLYNRDLPNWKIAFFFDPNQMQIRESSGGRLEGDHVTFNVSASRSGQEQSFSVRIHLYRKLAPGEVARTYASMIWDGTISPACSKHELRIIERPPVTGAGDGVDPVEDLRAFLRPASALRATAGRPVSAAAKGSPMPFILWAAIGIAGVAIGGRMGKRFV